jgi:TP901 family phage tail tape measure protein
MADVGEIRARLILNADDFNRNMNDARQSMETTGEAAGSLTSDIQAIQVTAATVGGAVAAIMGVAVTQAAQFEQKMSNIKSVSGANASEMEELADLAKLAGESTAYSATEAADGITELLKAGLSVEQVLNGGLTGALDLAAAGELELADAAAIASTALNAFRDDGLSVSDAANILAGAANASATDVSELKFGLSAVASVASSAGMDFEDTATSLALFAQNGLLGSDAGTSLKSVLMNLSPSTKEATEVFKDLGIITEDNNNLFYDSEGKLKSLSDITNVLRTAFEKLNPKEQGEALKTMFGSDGIRAGSILLKEGADGVERMADAMSKITAAETAATKLDNLLGVVDELKGSLETLGIEIGEDFLPLLAGFVKEATAFVRGLDEVDVKGGLTFAGVASAVALLVTGLTRLATAASALFTSMGPAGWLIAGISLLSGVIAGSIVHQREMSEVSLENAEAMMESHASLEANSKQYDELKLKSKLTSDELARFVDINSEIAKTADPNVIAALKDEQVKLQEKSGLSNDELQRLLDLNGQIIETVPESNTILTEQGNVLLENTNKAKEYNKEQLEIIRLELEAQKAKAEASMEKNLIAEEKLLGQMKTLKEDMVTLNEEELEQRRLVAGLEEDLATATENNDTDEINRLNNSIAVEKQKHQIMKDQSAEQADLILKKAEEIDKVQAQIGKLDEVKRKMIDLELQQAGINAKRGEEVTTIEQALAKLEAQKRKLEETTPIAQRNSGEYQEAVTHIQNQIDNLNTVKSRILDITDAASVMNYQLGQTIRKDVIIRQVEGQSLKRMPGLDDKFHTGGIIGRGQLPKLHTGGLASQFADMPSHNEVDVRLLRNEMVLTEAQQANLMRMIDAGMSGKSESNGTDSETHRLLAEIKKEIRTGLNATVVMQEREVARIIEPYVSEEQARNKSRKERF